MHHKRKRARKQSVSEHGGKALVAAEAVGDVEGQLQRLLAVQPGENIVNGSKVSLSLEWSDENARRTVRLVIALTPCGWWHVGTRPCVFVRKYQREQRKVPTNVARGNPQHQFYWTALNRI